MRQEQAPGPPQALQTKHWDLSRRDFIICDSKKQNTGALFGSFCSVVLKLLRSVYTLPGVARCSLNSLFARRTQGCSSAVAGVLSSRDVPPRSTPKSEPAASLLQGRELLFASPGLKFTMTIEQGWAKLRQSNLILALLYRQTTTDFAQAMVCSLAYHRLHRNSPLFWAQDDTSIDKKKVGDKLLYLGQRLEWDAEKKKPLEPKPKGAPHVRRLDEGFVLL